MPRMRFSHPECGGSIASSGGYNSNLGGTNVTPLGTGNPTNTQLGQLTDSATYDTCGLATFDRRQLEFEGPLLIQHGPRRRIMSPHVTASLTAGLNPVMLWPELRSGMGFEAARFVMGESNDATLRRSPGISDRRRRSFACWLDVCRFNRGARSSARSHHGHSYGSFRGQPAVPRAHVTATETGTGYARSITPDDTGRYTVPSWRPTEYSLTVEASGFNKYVQRNVTLVADQTATIDVQLKVGSTIDTVTVSAAGSDAPLVDAATPTLTEVVGNTRIEELPLNGRAVAQLIALVPGSAGASPTVVTSQSSLPGSVQPSINGARNAQTGYLLDGAPFLDQYYNTNIPFPFPDSLQEFSVQTSNYSARYGGNSGAVVNVVTKSGTNSLHGDLFAFNRNQDYNAANAFTGAVDPLHRTDFGGTVGGPVLYSALIQRPRSHLPSSLATRAHGRHKRRSIPAMFPRPRNSRGTSRPFPARLQILWTGRFSRAARFR